MTKWKLAKCLFKIKLNNLKFVNIMLKCLHHNLSIFENLKNSMCLSETPHSALVWLVLKNRLVRLGLKFISKLVVPQIDVTLTRPDIVLVWTMTPPLLLLSKSLYLPRLLTENRNAHFVRPVWKCRLTQLAQIKNSTDREQSWL